MQVPSIPIIMVFIDGLIMGKAIFGIEERKQDGQSMMMMRVRLVL